MLNFLSPFEQKWVNRTYNDHTHLENSWRRNDKYLFSTYTDYTTLNMGLIPMYPMKRS